MGRKTMINLESIKKTKGFQFTFVDKPIVDATYVKQLRTKLNLTQSMFALLLNVTKKTVEKWEQGKNPVSNGSEVAMIIFNNHPELVEDFLRIVVPEKLNEEYSIEVELEDTDTRSSVINNYKTPTCKPINWVPAR